MKVKNATDTARVLIDLGPETPSELMMFNHYISLLPNQAQCPGQIIEETFGETIQRRRILLSFYPSHFTQRTTLVFCIHRHIL